jgi:hypothetical protein
MDPPQPELLDLILLEKALTLWGCKLVH